METSSYLLAGTQKAFDTTFGSTCHGAGRVMSRMAAKRKVRGTDLREQMTKRGMVIRAVSMSGLAEEAGFAYKNIDEVVKAVDDLGISKKVIQLRPLGSIKG
jgi:tRNA-splicing ligase RtcB